MKLKNIMPLDLCLFDGEGAGATASAPGGETGDTKGAVPGRTHRGKSGEFQNVRFGKQPQEATASETVSEAQTAAPAAGENSEVQVTSNTLEDKKKAYRELVTGEYKDIHTDEMQRVINRRFGETKLLQETVDRQQPLIDMLMQRYKVDGGDIAKLTAAIENDEAYGMALAFLKDHQQDLEQLVKLLLQNFSLSGDDVANTLSDSHAIPTKEELDELFGEDDFDFENYMVD